MWYKISPKGFY